MDKLDEAIIRTQEYGRRYGVEYGKSEIKERLISRTIFKKEEIEKKLGKISDVRSQISEKNIKIKKAQKLADLIGKYFEDILMIGITGSVAAGYPKKNDDIDLMIITKKERLWLTRLMLRLLIKFKSIPHRKYGIEEKGDEFCFNLWMEEDLLTLPKERQNLKNAMDSILMIPVLNRNKTYEKFMKENDWIKKYLATAYDMLEIRFKIHDSRIKHRLITNILNWLVFWPQYWYMKPKIGDGWVNLKMAFFHPKK